ncbi:MAG: DUF86 domain-containing protein [Fluviicola sp.]|nr:DUF86 domain-containing protein [Fluviicola sp.]
MDERILKWLFDINTAIEEVDSFFDNKQKIFSEHKKNNMLKRAIERELEIIGEAVNRIIKQDESFLLKIDDAKNIIGLRNQIIHSYDNISDENIWAILINHLPRLKTQIQALLTEK